MSVSRARRLVVAAFVVLALTGPSPAFAQTGVTTTPAPKASPGVDPTSIIGRIRQVTSELTGQTVPAPTKPSREPRMTNAQATAVADRVPEVREWIAEHPVTRTTPEFKADEGKHIVWYIRKQADGTEVTEAQVWVEDATGRVTEVRIGPQVSWMMARGVDGAFGRSINKPAVWLVLCALFLVPLVRLRRIVSWRTLDLLVLLSFSASLVWFNRGEIFTSVPLAYPPMAYLLVRMVMLALHRVRSARQRPVADETAAPDGTPAAVGRPAFRGWAPTWVLVTALLVSVGLRYGLNAFDANVIDVGYAGVIGADRISQGATPYGTFPSDCGRCDTYGPLNYLLYVPFELAQPYTGKWDGLPAAHGAAVLFDLLCIVGLGVLGWRLGGRRLAAALSLAWAAYPFTAYALESNSNDALVSATLIWAVVVAANPLLRGLAMGLAVATKFGPALLIPLFARAPFPRPRASDRGRRGLGRYALGLAASIPLLWWVLLLDGDDGVRAFWSRTLSYQFGRESPFSLWGQHTGWKPVQMGLTLLVALAGLAVVRWPRHVDLRVVCALAAALLIGTQLTLTHWFYLYIPWFLPFVLIAVIPEWPAMIGPRRRPAAPEPEPEPEPDDEASASPPDEPRGVPA